MPRRPPPPAPVRLKKRPLCTGALPTAFHPKCCRTQDCLAELPLRTFSGAMRKKIKHKEKILLVRWERSTPLGGASGRRAAAEWRRREA